MHPAQPSPGTPGTPGPPGAAGSPAHRTPAPPLSQPVRHVPLVQQVADQLRAQVRDGVWPVGTRIPGELALAAQLGVSRSTVREALRALSLAGLLEPRVGDGTYVRARDELQALLGGRSQVEHALEVGAVLDEAAAVRAARRRTPEHLAVLQAALQARREAGRAHDAEAFVRADQRFHRALVEATGNPLMLRLYDAVEGTMADTTRTTAVLPQDDELDRVHQLLAEAVAAGDADRAAVHARALAREVAFLAALDPAPPHGAAPPSGA